MPGNLWFIYALSAAVLWGFSYAVSGRLMELQLSPSFLLVTQYVVSLPFYIGIAACSGTLRSGFANLATNPGRLGIFLATLLGTLIANFLMMMSISQRNATLASLIEITYPLFTLMFAYILFRQVQLTMSTALGGVLIFAGSSLSVLRGGNDLRTGAVPATGFTLRRWTSSCRSSAEFWSSSAPLWSSSAAAVDVSGVEEKINSPWLE